MTRWVKTNADLGHYCMLFRIGVFQHYRKTRENSQKRSIPVEKESRHKPDKADINTHQSQTEYTPPTGVYSFRPDIPHSRRPPGR